jgi:hypothetical protein
MSHPAQSLFHKAILHLANTYGNYGKAFTHILLRHKQTNDISLISKIYVWSVVFEPLLFFIIWDEWTAGIGGNLSRIFQGFVLFALILKYLIKSSDLRIINFSNLLYRNYGIYLSVAIFAGLVNALSGGYDVSMNFSSPMQSYFASLLNSHVFRPLFEYVIAIYYFIYFVVLSRYLLETDRDIRYFFLVFKTMFMISLIVGVVDLAAAFYNVRLVPCHIANWPQWAGQRFHGLAGEPRHAFVYLFLGLAVFNIEAHIKGKSLSKLWIVTVICTAILTQSTSGFVGIAVFLILFSVDSLTYKMNVQRYFLLFAIFTLTPLLIFGVINSSTRLSLYLASTTGLWSLLESGSELPYYLMVQSGDIFPLYDLTVKARDLNILPIIIGSGLGSASAINNSYVPFAAGQMINPNSQLVRSLFENGIIGTFFFIMSFISPVKRLTRHIGANDRFRFIILTWLLIGCFMGIRSSALFIYLGIFFAVFAPFHKAKKESSL